MTDRHSVDALSERLLSPDDVAAFLGVPVTTLYQWRYKGIGPRGLRVGRHLRYRQSDVDAWLRTLDDDDGHRRSA
jgi:excisionase family DNA binding protein